MSFTKGALASRIVVGLRGTGSSPSLTPFEDAVDIRYRPAQHGHLPDRSNLPLPAAQLILEKKREAEVRDDVGHERYGGRALCAGCGTRDIEDAFIDEAGGGC